VELIENDTEVILSVNGWEVFILRDNGYGELVSDISDDNGIGLQVDKDGRIKLMEKRNESYS